MNKQKAFSLIEVLVVIGILLILVLFIVGAKGKNYTVKVIDNHEYIVYGGRGSITHKADCVYCVNKENK